MSRLLIEDLSQKDNSCSLSRNEAKHIHGGECHYLGSVQGSDGKEYAIIACVIP